MAKRQAEDAAPAQVRAVTTFVVGVRVINAGEVFSADDELVAEVPTMFEPVPVDGDGGEA